MNHSCAVIGVAVNVTQWTPPGSRHKNRQTRYFALLYVNFARFLEIWARERYNNALQIKMLKKRKKNLSPTGLEPRLSGPHEQISLFWVPTSVTSISTNLPKNSKTRRDAHLDHLGFPKMYEPWLCGDRCGRKRDAMDPSKGGSDRQTDRRTDRKVQHYIPTLHGG